MSGIFMHVEIRKVPVDRLARNIERQLQAKPDNIELRLNLARLYAMAYALKVTDFDTRDKKSEAEAWFGYHEPHLPGPVREAPSREHHERAKADLARAIKVYADVIARAPNNVIAHLGHAWALEQAGDKAAAIRGYRRVIEVGWKKDLATDSFWERPATWEAAERLRELLDPVADAKEIAALEDKQAQLDKKGRMITPIAIPLGPEPEHVPVDPHARVLFDADGSGTPKHWSWITPDAGWLVHDPDGGGQITSALQWFGNVSFWLFWTNGYQPLGALDDDGDGQLTGRELAHLAIWQDVNQNGRSERGEVKPLSAHGVVALACAYEDGDGVTTAAESRAGVRFEDGSTRPTFDVILHQSRRVTTVTPHAH